MITLLDLKVVRASGVPGGFFAARRAYVPGPVLVGMKFSVMNDDLPNTSDAACVL
jgi:hypothetical protein